MSEDQSPEAEALSEMMRDFGAAMGEWLDRMRQHFDAILEIASRPEVREAIERAAGQPRPRPCYCFCAVRHPGDKGVCDGEGVTVRRFTSEATGPVDVSLCAPCAVSQGLAELPGPPA